MAIKNKSEYLLICLTLISTVGLFLTRSNPILSLLFGIVLFVCIIYIELLMIHITVCDRIPFILYIPIAILFVYFYNYLQSYSLVHAPRINIIYMLSAITILLTTFVICKVHKSQDAILLVVLFFIATAIYLLFLYMVCVPAITSDAPVECEYEIIDVIEIQDVDKIWKSGDTFRPRGYIKYKVEYIGNDSGLFDLTELELKDNIKLDSGEKIKVEFYRNFIGYAYKFIEKIK